MNQVVIGIGSNIRPHENILKARDALHLAFGVKRISRFLVTKPIGKIDQADFVNGVLLIETSWQRDRLKQWLKNLEKSLGRKRGGDRYGPRTIDLDILVWNNCVVDPELSQRDFLKNLLADLKLECCDGDK